VLEVEDLLLSAVCFCFGEGLLRKALSIFTCVQHELACHMCGSSCLSALFVLMFGCVLKRRIIFHERNSCLTFVF
jgi:hypothetical protein